jgi:uncharacterized protein (TIGR03083 family)
MTDLQSLVGPTYNGLADLLASAAIDTWDKPSLCEKWRVRHVIAHATMPARLTPQNFGDEMAAAGGEFNVLSDTVAARDAALPVADHLEALRSDLLHHWQPPGGGEAGARSHAVIHSLDVTIPLDCPAVAPTDARVAVLDLLTASNGEWFGVDLTDLRLKAADIDWTRGNGNALQADSGRLIALLSGRSLPDGRALPRAQQ